ncbi:IS110 family transposase [Rheinheimera sp. 1928-s]|uniref:IS110 family transposase n=1 Tax=Rheinheimera sp. 1928-s TaxID=3033803 RepID=UPI002601FEFF|nr:IS110 family transposase [Rheinheimera sp. 1928-s]MDF3123721.1 IS110 family transposase [Rheinheimera sp. 1928-s]
MENLINGFSAFIGLDWASKKHDVCVQIGCDGKRRFEVIPHSPEALDSWLGNLQKEAGGNIAVAVELTRGPIVYLLQKYSFITVFPIHALSLARYRQAFAPSGAKDDPSDAEIALDLMLKYPSKVKPLKPSSKAVRVLFHLVEQRRLLIDDKRRQVNRLINALKQYYPQPLEWFSHRDSELFCDFLLRWPSLQSLKRSRENTIRMFFQSRGGNAVKLTDKRLTAIHSAIPITHDEGVIFSHQMLVSSLVRQIKVQIENIRLYDLEIKSLFSKMPDAHIFESLPGTGPCLAPRLLAAMGDDRERFTTAQQLQNFAGLSPVTERSGKKSWVHWRWQCAKFVRQSFVEWAAKSVHQSYWAELYYQQQRKKGKSHQSAVRALAYKWARIVFRCWKTKQPYDESTYLKSLRDRNSHLLAA